MVDLHVVSIPVTAMVAAGISDAVAVHDFFLVWVIRFFAQLPLAQQLTPHVDEYSL